jgi:hypothetical protein
VGYNGDKFLNLNSSENFEIREKLAARESGAQMELIDAKKNTKKSRLTVPLMNNLLMKVQTGTLGTDLQPPGFGFLDPYDLTVNPPSPSLPTVLLIISRGLPARLLDRSNSKIR